MVSKNDDKNISKTNMVNSKMTPTKVDKRKVITEETNCKDKSSRGLTYNISAKNKEEYLKKMKQVIE